MALRMPKKREPSKRVNLRLLLPDYERVQALAKIYGTTAAGLTTWALMQWVVEQEGKERLRKAVSDGVASATFSALEKDLQAFNEGHREQLEGKLKDLGALFSKMG